MVERKLSYSRPTVSKLWYTKNLQCTHIVSKLCHTSEQVFKYTKLCCF